MGDLVALCTTMHLIATILAELVQPGHLHANQRNSLAFRAVLPGLAKLHCPS
jgi:hypothetical protein